MTNEKEPVVDDNGPEIKVDVVEIADEEVPTAAASTTATNTTNDDDDDDASKTSSVATSKPLRSVTPTAGRIFSLIRAEIPYLVLGLLLIFVSEAATLAVPRIIARAYNELQNYFFDLGVLSTTTETMEEGNGDIEEETYSEDDLFDGAMRQISNYMGTAIGVYVAGMLAGFVRGVMLGIIGERLVARLRKRVYESVLHQEVGFFDEHKTGEIVSRLGTDTQILQQAVSQFAPESARGIITVIVSLVLMFSIDARLTAVALAAMVIVCTIAIPFGQKLAKLSKLYQDVLGDAQSRSTEALGSIRTVLSFVAEPKELMRYLEKIGDPDDAAASKGAETTYTVGVKKAIVTVAVFTVVFGGSFGFLYLTLWYGFYLVIEGSLTLGDLTAFQSYVFIIGGAIGTTATNLTQVVSAVAACGRVFYLLERRPNIKNYDGISDDDEEEDDGNVGETKEGTKNAKQSPAAAEKRKCIVPSTPMEGNIAFENVMFSYPTRPDVLVLNAFSLKLAKNTTTALVGSSGSGKSTVVSLIQRFYDIDAGTILLDGRDITHLDMSWFRSQIGYVQQEPQLFGTTVRENLVYGLSLADEAKITQTELENVCRDANAHEFISSWPEGYDTVVGERGITLSGGQKQRIAIARALLTNCGILLLDEATSALDAESEHEVQKAIENAMVGRTVVVVAHRLSTIQNADQIVVMDNRKIVDVGTHGDLLARCKRYQDLIKRQQQNPAAKAASSPEFITTTIDEEKKV